MHDQAFSPTSSGWHVFDMSRLLLVTENSAHCAFVRGRKASSNRQFILSGGDKWRSCINNICRCHSTASCFNTSGLIGEARPASGIHINDDDRANQEESIPSLPDVCLETEVECGCTDATPTTCGTPKQRDEGGYLGGSSCDTGSTALARALSRQQSCTRRGPSRPATCGARSVAAERTS